jgi:branched-chain amino acid transport system permease protein
MSILCINAARIIWGSEPLRFPELFATTAYEFGGVRISPQLFWIMVMGVAIMGALQLFLKYTPTGLAMQAVAQDQEAAQLMGANLTRMMGFITGLKGFVAATLGGLGSIAGAMLGGILFGLIETFSTVFLSSAYKDGIGMILLIAILLVLPSGLVGLWQKRR